MSAAEDGFCCECAFRNSDGACLNPHSNEFEEIVDDEHGCWHWEDRFIPDD